MTVNWAIIGLANDLLPLQVKAITRGSADLLPIVQNYVKIQIQNYSSRKCIWKSLLQNGGNFVQV